MTSVEIRELKDEYGITNNFQDSGWILPDGDMLQMYRTADDYLEHESIVFPEGYVRRCGYDCSTFEWQDIMTLGWIRISFAETMSFMTVLVQPTRAQMNRLYDLLDVDFSLAYDYFRGRTGIFQFELELPGKFIKYDDEKEFKKRFLNDIRNAF